MVTIVRVYTTTRQKATVRLSAHAEASRGYSDQGPTCCDRASWQVSLVVGMKSGGVSHAVGSPPMDAERALPLTEGRRARAVSQRSHPKRVGPAHWHCGFPCRRADSRSDKPVPVPIWSHAAIHCIHCSVMVASARNFIASSTCRPAGPQPRRAPLRPLQIRRITAPPIRPQRLLRRALYRGLVAAGHLELALLVRGQRDGNERFTARRRAVDKPARNPPRIAGERPPHPHLFGRPRFPR